MTDHSRGEPAAVARAAEHADALADMPHGHAAADAAHDGIHDDAIHLPSPTLRPLVMGAGITLLAFGVVTHWTFSLVGLFLMARALVGWIEELRYE